MTKMSLKPEITRDIQAHPIFTDEQLREVWYLLHDVGTLSEGADQAFTKIEEALTYREKKDGPTQADRTAAQRAARAEATERQEAQEGR